MIYGKSTLKSEGKEWFISFPGLACLAIRLEEKIRFFDLLPDKGKTLRWIKALGLNVKIKH